MSEIYLVPSRLVIFVNGFGRHNCCSGEFEQLRSCGFWKLNVEEFDYANCVDCTFIW